MSVTGCRTRGQAAAAERRPTRAAAERAKERTHEQLTKTGLQGRGSTVEEDREPQLRQTKITDKFRQVKDGAGGGLHFWRNFGGLANCAGLARLGPAPQLPQ